MNKLILMPLLAFATFSYGEVVLYNGNCVLLLGKKVIGQTTDDAIVYEDLNGKVKIVKDKWAVVPDNYWNKMSRKYKCKKK